MDIYLGLSKETDSTFFANKTYNNFGINYAFMTDENKVFGHKGNCHSGMNTLDNWVKGTPVRFFSQLRWGANDYEDALDFWVTLFDGKTSPWRNLFVGLDFLTNKEGQKIAFSLSIDDETNNQFLTNLCMASRFPFEHPDAFKLYVTLRKEGKLSRAQCLIASLVTKNQLKSLVIQELRGHHPFNGPGAVCFEKLFNGSPSYHPAQTVKTFSRYFPCNSIWTPTLGSNSVRSIFERCMEKTPKEFRGVFNVLKAQYKNNFGESFTINKDALYTVMKEHYPHE